MCTNKQNIFATLALTAGFLALVTNPAFSQIEETPSPSPFRSPNAPAGPRPTATVTPLQSTPVPTATVVPLPSASPSGTQPQTTNTVAPSPSPSASSSATIAQTTNTVTPSPSP